MKSVKVADGVDKPVEAQHTQCMWARNVRPPKFEAKIPDELMEQWHELDPVMKVVLREQSILRQQTEWILMRCTTGCPAIMDIPKLEKDVESLVKLRDVLTAKWSVVAFLFATLIMPTIMMVLGVVISRHL